MKPPLLYPDTNYSVQQIEILKVSELLSHVSTDGTAILTNGMLSNLNDPVNNNDISNLDYLIKAEPEPSGSTYDIQYVEPLGKEFKGSSNFTFNGTTMTTDILTNNAGVVIANGTINGITNTSASNSAVNKHYVDVDNNLTSTTLILSSGLTYSSGQMVNGIIYRDPVTSSISNTFIDTTANAISIITQFKDQSVGNSAIFYLKNITSTSSVYVFLKPGTGVTFNNTTNGITVPQNYLLKARLIIQASNTVLMYIESIEYSASASLVKNINTSISLIPYNIKSMITDSFKNNTAFFMNYYDDQALNYGPLTWASIFNGQVSRSGLSSNITLTFPEPASFFFTSINSTGYYRFIIRNDDPTYSITLQSSNGWNLDTNSNFIIGPQKSMLLWFYLNISSSGAKSINVYVIGTMDLI
jgi:hypothetical protein